MVEKLLKQLKKFGKFDGEDRDHHNQVLTNAERYKLAEWSRFCTYISPSVPSVTYM